MCKHCDGLSLHHVMECGVWCYPMGNGGLLIKKVVRRDTRPKLLCFCNHPHSLSWWYEGGKCGSLLGPHIIRHSAMFYPSVVWLQPLFLLWKATEIVKHHINFNHHSWYNLSEVLCRKNRISGVCTPHFQSNARRRIFSLLYHFVYVVSPFVQYLPRSLRLPTPCKVTVIVKQMKYPVTTVNI